MLSSQSINQSMECLLTKLSRTNKIPAECVLPFFKNNRPCNKNKIENKAIWRHYFGKMCSLEVVLSEHRLPDRNIWFNKL